MVSGKSSLFSFTTPRGIEPKRPANGSGLSYGPISAFYLVMYDGYSALPVQYECAFEGKETAQQCDYGIKVNTHQIVLPKSVKTYPSSIRDSFSEDTKWVRKSVFIAYLQKLSN